MYLAKTVLCHLKINTQHNTAQHSTASLRLNCYAATKMLAAAGMPAAAELTLCYKAFAWRSKLSQVTAATIIGRPAPPAA